MNFFQYIKSKEFLSNLLAVFALLLLFIFVLGRGLKAYTNHNERISVPNLEKLSVEEAEKVLAEQELAFVVIDSSNFNPDYPPKSVIEQDPEAGSYVKHKRKIYLTLNPSDYMKVQIPNVIDETKRQVVTRLRSSGFMIGKERFIPDLGKNVVRMLEYQGREIKPGEYLPKNSILDLVLGDGLEELDSLARTDTINNAGEF
ncbi:MAG: PASTA domain-containing protein [Lutimonas sp.]